MPNDVQKKIEWLIGMNDREIPSLTVQEVNRIRTWILGNICDLPFEQGDHIIEAAIGLGLFNESILERFGEFYQRKLKKDLLFERTRGSRCPTCDQYAKEYKRTVSSNMCVFLRSLITEYFLSRSQGEDGWVHYKKCKFGSRDYPHLALWDLAHTRSSECGKKRTTGEWKPTKRGIDFLFGKTTVPKYIYTYNGKKVGENRDEFIDFRTALGENSFDYTEIMSAIPDTELMKHGIERED